MNLPRKIIMEFLSGPDIILLSNSILHHESREALWEVLYESTIKGFCFPHKELPGDNSDEAKLH